MRPHTLTSKTQTILAVAPCVTEVPAGTGEPDTAKATPLTPAVPTGGPVRWLDLGLATALWAVTMLVYTESGAPMLDLGSDVVPSIWLPLPILRQGRFSFDSLNYPFFFSWAQLDPKGEPKGRIPTFRKFDECVLALAPPPLRRGHRHASSRTTITTTTSIRP